MKAQFEVHRTVTELDGQILPQKSHVDVNGSALSLSPSLTVGCFTKQLLWCVSGQKKPATRVPVMSPFAVAAM